MGRRVLFLYPPSVVEEELIEILIAAQFEAGIIRDHRLLGRVLGTFPQSVLFANPESHIPGTSCEMLVRKVLATQSHHGADVGIITYNNNPDLARLYLMDIGVRAGYITLKMGLNESARVLIRTLEAIEARGRRKYVRVRVPDGRAKINALIDGQTISGLVQDISVAGLGCVLKADLQAGTELDDCSLNLWGRILTVRGRVIGRRDGEDASPYYAVLFSSPIGGEDRKRFNAFARRMLQMELDAIVESKETAR